MSAPVRFVRVYDGDLLVKVGKSDQLRPVELTRAERLSIIRDLAAELRREEDE